MFESAKTLSFRATDELVASLLGERVLPKYFGSRSTQVASRIWRELALKIESAFVHVCSRGVDFRGIGKVNKREQSCAKIRKQGTNKKGHQRFYSCTGHLPLDLNSRPILPAFSLTLNPEIPFPRIPGGKFAGAKSPPNSNSTIV